MRNSKSKKNVVAIAALVLVVAVAGILAACSGGNGDNNGGKTGSSSNNSSSQTPAPTNNDSLLGGHYPGLVTGSEATGYSLDTKLWIQYLSTEYYHGKELVMTDFVPTLPCERIRSYDSAGYGTVYEFQPTVDTELIKENGGVYAGSTRVQYSTELGILTKVEEDTARENRN